jgi:hypothetical protein
LALNQDPAIMSFNYFLYHGKPKSCTAGIFSSVFPDPVKFIKYQVCLILWDPYSLIFNNNAKVIFFFD